MAFTWIPFYKELAQKLLQFRNDRKPLVDFIYSDLSTVGSKSLVDYIHMENGSKVTDIDPFSVFAIFNRSLKRENRLGFLQKFKDRFNLKTEMPTDFDGIPTVNSQRAFFFNWAEKNAESIRQFWDLFEIVVLEKDISSIFDQMVNKTISQYSLTMILYWIAPNRFLNLDGRNRSYLSVLGFPDKYPNLDYSNYSKLILDVRKKMDDHSIPCSSFPELSYAAFLNSPKKQETGKKSEINAITYWIYSPGEQAVFWDDYYQDGIMGLGWNKISDLKQYKTQNDLIAPLKKYYGSDNSQVKNANMLFDFANNMKPGDIVFAKKGRSMIVGRGVVTSDYYYDGNRENQPHLRKVEWTDKGEWKIDFLLAMKTLTNLTRYKEDVDKLNNLFDRNDKVEEPLETPSPDANYWWLVAKPAIWSVSDMKIGEEQYYTFYNDDGNRRRIFQHFLNAKVGDVVVGYESSPRKQVMGLLTISKVSEGEAIYFKKTKDLPPIDYSSLRAEPDLLNMEYMKNQQGSFFKLTPKEFNIIMRIASGEKVEIEKYTKADFLNDVFVSDSDFESLKYLLLRKKNLILQGAPGVGKTFAAKRLAYAIMGEKDEKRIMQVQFHQNYSYEDFVMGYKPNENGGFELVEGKFYQFCQDAKKDRGHDYFFIIDEINRGNLIKIFGELLMLIENDYRDKEIQLSYRDENFSVPSNIYIVGMMNTADRSLALIDYALRRRFSFFEMKPGFDNPVFDKEIKAKNDSHLDDLVKAIADLNKVIENDDSLGSGFCIGHSYLCNLGTDYNLESIVEYDIIPMLREYWFDNDNQFNQEAQKLRAAIK